ncbi:arginyltransferase [Octadecabacter ascidiaceicola]|uniref:Aspartate/glutamate leucyltransferase n=1 Tax=Octadecabacter ascidiaceicola TaxID=1655543 RepID=A0A238JMZ7_9RHOB|nr:arginyltransferase [Octadecabacter ascidiaceicola]SMX32050.1 arginyl-tRNA-protein transferase [Octadecabacter ascidiaceicola]
MRHSLPIAPQFYVTAPQPCPYLADRMERKLFTALQGDAAEQLNNSLSKQGFRRSQNVLYRPSCADCAACLSARIKVADFAPSKSQKRVLKRNTDLTRSASSPWATEAQYALFRDYLDSRHATGGMADMDLFEFAAMVEETPIRTRLIEYRSAHAEATVLDDPYEGLRAVSLTDILDDGLSMVYSFFAPELMKSSVGTYLILDHIQIARELELPYVYLGYWVPGSDKMGYKANFKGVEIYRDGAWKPLGNPDDYNAETGPLAVPPIAEQVARITLPGSEG